MRPGRRVPEPVPGRWRRRAALLRILLLSALWLASAAGVRPAECLVYIGTYTGQGSEGIYVCRFDPATGETGPVRLAAPTDHPSFLAVDPKGRFLYAVNELDTFQGRPSGAVSAFGIERASGRLTLRQQVASLGAAPAHLSLDRSGRYLLVANYNGGNCAVFPVGTDGRLAAHSAFVQNAGSGPHPERQAGPHAHCIQVTRDNRFALVADLGIDRVLVYRFDAGDGSLSPGRPAYAQAEAGAGPRHLAESPSGKFLYVLNELASTVAVYAFEQGPETLRAQQIISTLPEKFTGPNTAAEIAVDAGGRFLYASNRGDDSIVVFRIHPGDGSLKLLERVPSGGRTPRHFAIDPTGRWLWVANQDSDDIRLFRIDPAGGRLSATPRSLRVSRPVCVGFVPAG